MQENDKEKRKTSKRVDCGKARKVWKFDTGAKDDLSPDEDRT